MTENTAALSARVRGDNRAVDQMRAVRIERGVAPYAEGSCLVSFGDTRVLCAVSVEEGVPGWKRGKGEGWITAEYAMLPRATKTRTGRERSQVGGRTQEIQRLIGRSVRAMINSFSFGEFTLKVDCDVLQADGGTRTAAITGASVAVTDAFRWMLARELIAADPVVRHVAAVSVGIVDNVAVLDLNYEEDVRAEVDMNIVMSSEMQFVELQGTGERATFDAEQLNVLLRLATTGVKQLMDVQNKALQS